MNTIEEANMVLAIVRRDRREREKARRKLAMKTGVRVGPGYF